jgi:gamma-glutamylcyclotransferase (GGCT)/AIG2-like uncharacterized protein YtfP
MTEAKKLTYERADPKALTPGRVRVFVYGTLKRGQSNHGLLINEQYIGADCITMNGRMIDLGAFPGVVRDQQDEGTIRGEVYEVCEDTLNALDWLEGHPTFYRRDKYKTATGIRCWMYTLPDAASYDRCGAQEDSLWNPTDDEREFWNASEL